MLEKFVRMGALSALLISAAVMASQYGTRDQAIDMAARAVALIEDVGIKSARIAFETPTGEWHDRDLYVFVYDNEGTALAHGTKSSMVGRNLYKLRDIDGVQILREFLKIEQGKSGWVNYKWQNPITKSVDRKSSYIIRKDEYLVGVGIHLD